MPEQPVLEWPPNFKVKSHPKTRRVKLQASPLHGLEILIPKKFNLKHIPLILEENRAWIEKQLLKLQARPAIEKIDTLPTEIVLNSIQQTWKIACIASNTKVKLVMRPYFELVLLGEINNFSACKQLLIHWIKKQANLHLCEQLKHLSKELKLPFKSVTIRDQNTRWGSCSADKSINLSYKLLFLPTDLANHVLIHELCHTVHLNHSTKFWQLVAEYDPYCEKHRKELKQAEQFIPAWVS